MKDLKDLKHEGKEIKSELKAGDQDHNKSGGYNPQQKQPINKTNQPLPGKGQQSIGGNKGGFGGDVANKDRNINKGDKGGSWK